MNYIKHFKAWLQHASNDRRLTAQHITVYVALFHHWNLNRFENPFSIHRREIMRMSKVGSANTYARVLKELDTWRYIRYELSFNPQQSSRVYLYRFDTRGDTSDDAGADIATGIGDDTGGNTGSDACPDIRGDTGSDTLYKTILNSKNVVNSKNKINLYGTSNETSDFVNGGSADTPSEATDSNGPRPAEKAAGERGRAGAERPGPIPSSLQEAQAYFNEIHSTAAEAEKFYNHFQSNGWKVGGRSAMQDWRAAARNWVINAKKFTYEPTTQPKPGKLNTGPKNYSEPL